MHTIVLLTKQPDFHPFYLLFGRSQRLPVDLLFGTSSSVTNESHTGYVERWKDAMKDAYTKANNNSTKAANAGKRIYNSNVHYTELKAGDRVLVRNLCERVEVLESCDLTGRIKYTKKLNKKKDCLYLWSN